MKRLKELSNLKKLMILFGCILLIFAILNIVWLIERFLPYQYYRSKVDKVYDELYEKDIYYKIIDGYRYRVGGITYLSYGGSLTCAREEGAETYVDDDGNITGSNGLYIVLYIYPSVFHEDIYGLGLMDQYEEVDYLIYIDKNGNILEDEDPDFYEDVNKIVAENKVEIDYMLQASKELWGLK